MRGRIRALLAGLGVVVLIVFVLWAGREERSPRSASATPVGPSAPPAERALELVDGGSVMQPPGSPTVPDQNERKPIAAPAGALLIVRAVARGSGRPLADIAVQVRRVNAQDMNGIAVPAAVLDGQGGPARARPKVRTGADGTFACPVAAGIPLWLTLRSDALIADGAQRRIWPLKPLERRVMVVELPFAEVHAFGRVVDRERGFPLAGVRIDANGALDSGSEVGFDADLDSNDEESLANRFEPGPANASALRDDPDVKPLAVSDAGGSFELSLARRYARLGIVLRLAGCTPILAQLEPGHESQGTAQVFRLTRGAELDGRVSDGNGRGLAGLAVTVKASADAVWPRVPARDAGPGAARQSWSATTDEDGRFHLGGLPAFVALALEVQRADERPPEQRVLVLAPGERRMLELVVPDPIVLRGLVLDERGAPVPGLVLWIDRAPSSDAGYFGVGVADAGPSSGAARALAALETNEEGRFSVAHAPPGLWRVGPAPSTRVGKRGAQRRPAVGPFAPSWSVIEIRPAPPEQELVLHVERGVYLRGRVVSPDGEPAPGASLALRSDACAPPPMGKSANDGSFALGPLGAGEYILRAGGIEGWLASEELRVRATSGSDVNGLVLCLRPSAGSLHGRVVSGALPHGKLIVSAFGSEDASVARTNPGANGEFVFPDLAPGVYDLVAQDQRGAFGSLSGAVPAPDDGDELTLELQPAAHLRVTYIGDAARAALCIRRAGATLARLDVGRGTSTLLSVPPGLLTVELTPAGSAGAELAAQRCTRAVAAVLGDEVELVLP